MISCFVLVRVDCGQFYKGDQEREPLMRWSPELKKAKRYKRSGDAVNAIRMMQAYCNGTSMSWTKQTGAFVVREYEMILVNERVI